MDRSRRCRFRAWHLHTLLFVAGAAALIVSDLESKAGPAAATFLGLEWAHIVILIWIPILATHLALTWWDGRFEGPEDAIEVPFRPHRSKRH